jgi:hypothetical protein
MSSGGSTSGHSNSGSSPELEREEPGQQVVTGIENTFCGTTETAFGSTTAGNAVDPSGDLDLLNEMLDLFGDETIAMNPSVNNNPSADPRGLRAEPNIHVHEPALNQHDEYQRTYVEHVDEKVRGEGMADGDYAEFPAATPITTGPLVAPLMPSRQLEAAIAVDPPESTIRCFFCNVFSTTNHNSTVNNNPTTVHNHKHTHHDGATERLLSDSDLERGDRVSNGPCALNDDGESFMNDGTSRVGPKRTYLAMAMFLLMLLIPASLGVFTNTFHHGSPSPATPLRPTPMPAPAPGPNPPASYASCFSMVDMHSSLHVANTDDMSAGVHPYPAYFRYNAFEQLVDSALPANSTVNFDDDDHAEDDDATVGAGAGGKVLYVIMMEGPFTADKYGWTIFLFDGNRFPSFGKLLDAKLSHREFRAAILARVENQFSEGSSSATPSLVDGSVLLRPGSYKLNGVISGADANATVSYGSSLHGGVHMDITHFMVQDQTGRGRAPAEWNGRYHMTTCGEMNPTLVAQEDPAMVTAAEDAVAGVAPSFSPNSDVVGKGFRFPICNAVIDKNHILRMRHSKGNSGLLNWKVYERRVPATVAEGGELWVILVQENHMPVSGAPWPAAWTVLRYNATRHPSFASFAPGSAEIWEHAMSVHYPFGANAAMGSAPDVSGNYSTSSWIFPPFEVDSIYSSWTPRAECYNLKHLDDATLLEPSADVILPPPRTGTQLGGIYCDPLLVKEQGVVYYGTGGDGAPTLIAKNFGHITGTYKRAKCPTA